MATYCSVLHHHFQVIVVLFLLNLYCWTWNSHIFAAETTTNVYIVYMGERQHDNPETTEKSNHDMLSTLLGSKEAAKNSIIYSYKHGFSGFAATLTDSQAKSIADMPGVVRVFPNRIHKLQTTRSWDFLGLDPNVHSHSNSNLLSKANMGDGVIIGVIDSGIWPESESFKDDNMGPIPSRWKGICQTGVAFNSTHCNKKLIGARWFAKGVDEAGIVDYLSPRDNTGHGTHCASIAGGRFVPNASFGGLGTGLARGGAPLARLAMYKVCWADQGCSDIDALKAFDMAIHDGVDIISASIGESYQPLKEYFANGISIGAFHAVANGITVVNSAGNDGPNSYTVEDTAPWFISVAATTIDRVIQTQVTLGNNQTFLGKSLSPVEDKGFIDIVYSADLAININSEAEALVCKEGSLNETLVKGNVVLCFLQPSEDSEHNISDAYFSVVKAGGVGLIFTRPHNDLIVECPDIPCIKVDYEIGTNIANYIRRKTRNMPTVVKLNQPKSVDGISVAPRVATFSSRGPSSLSPAVLKPDIAAPGVNILAAYPPPLNNGHGYKFLSGTSMACPHVSGVSALLKSLHKDWSPAAIRSAIVTTASTTGTNGQAIMAQGSTNKPADPFDMGGGNINPNKAVDPGMVYNISKENYIQFLCSMGYTSEQITFISGTKKVSCLKSYSDLDLNLPYISIPNLKNTITVTRTVTNVGPTNSLYKASVESPHGVGVKVEPQTLSFSSAVAMLSFKVTFTPTQKLLEDYSFGSLTWTDGQHLVRIPLAVRVVGYESYVDT